MSLIIEKAAEIADGSIKRLESEQITEALKATEAYEGSLCKFTPSSGAASRMFKPLFEEGDEADELKRKLRENTPIDFTVAREVLASTPKGLLPFHKYDGFVRTPLQEHLTEAVAYAKNKNGACNLYFTVSEEHRNEFERHCSAASREYASKTGLKFNCSFSVQEHNTDVTAYDEDGKPFIKADGSILKRPAGHGALLGNLNLCKEDFIFIKNIDNVVKESFLEDTVKWKKILLGVAIGLRRKVLELTAELSGTDSKEVVDKVLAFLQEQFCVTFASRPSKDTLLNYLNRPLRVCGMVKNEGEPGGGPFICREKDGSTSLQILESVQIEDKSLMKGSTHFNPVDIVCCVKDVRGDIFNLQQFVDFETGLSVEKSFEGRTAKYTELPGLWNGSMSRWNTQFVEVPLSTFNPVKTVADLLRPAHQ